MTMILCRILGHRRSASRAYRTNSGWRSSCKRCGAKLVRVGPSHWVELPELKRAA